MRPRFLFGRICAGESLDTKNDKQESIKFVIPAQAGIQC